MQEACSDVGEQLPLPDRLDVVQAAATQRELHPHEQLGGATHDGDVHQQVEAALAVQLLAGGVQGLEVLFDGTSLTPRLEDVMTYEEW